MLDSIDARVRARAASALSSLTYEDWQGQVIEYLEEDALDEYAGEDRFDDLQVHALALLELDR